MSTGRQDPLIAAPEVDLVLAPADAMPTPSLPHLTIEFFTWLWFASDRDGGYDLPGVGEVDVWVDERLSFRAPDEDRPRVVLTGDNPSSTPEAHASLTGGKVVRDLRVGIRRDDREYLVTLRGVHLDLQALKLPPTASGGGDSDRAEVLYERLFLYEDLWSILTALYIRFAEVRTSASWASQTLPAMRAWAAGEPA